MCPSPEANPRVQGEAASVGTEEVVGTEPSTKAIETEEPHIVLDPKGRVPIVPY